jgi:[ribosomal protein S18]-alanine N-acetyltransferase
MSDSPPSSLWPDVSPSTPIALAQPIKLVSATIAELDQLVELDRQCFGQLWSRDAYAREIDSPNSDILLLQPERNGDQATDQTTDQATDQTIQALTNGSNPPTDACADPPIAIGYGCVWSILDEAHITILGVHPQFRRQGLGEVLLYGLFVAAHQRGLTRATLEVSSQNHAAIALYEKIGFQRAGCRKGYYDNGDDAAILWKSGLQHPQFKRDLADWEFRVGEKTARSGWMIRSNLYAPS